MAVAQKYNERITTLARIVPVCATNGKGLLSLDAR